MNRRLRICKRKMSVLQQTSTFDLSETFMNIHPQPQILKFIFKNRNRTGACLLKLSPQRLLQYETSKDGSTNSNVPITKSMVEKTSFYLFTVLDGSRTRHVEHNVDRHVRFVMVFTGTTFLKISF